MWQEGGGTSHGEPGGWCVSTHVNNLPLPCAGGSNGRKEASVREGAARWKRSAARLARQEEKKGERDSREDANAVVTPLFYTQQALIYTLQGKQL